MMREELLTRLQAVFREVFDDYSLKIKETTAQSNLRAWDSMAQITLLIALESEFDVAFTAREAGEMVSVSSILDHLQRKLGTTRTHV